MSDNFFHNFSTMWEMYDITLPALKYISGESTNICRLCFGATEGGAALDETRLLQCSYFDDAVTFMEMFTELGIISDPALPQTLCAYCADCAINSFLFQKLCQNSQSQWYESLEKFNKTLDLSDALAATVKTAYIVIQNDDSVMLTSKKIHELKTKEGAVKKIKELIKARMAYNGKVKKKSLVVCEECGEKFPLKSCLAKHMRLHRNLKHSCTHCPKVFPSKTQVKDHIERVHKPKVLQCPKCDKMFSTSKMLKYHDSINHQAAVCKRCFIQFPSKKHLKQHLDKHDLQKCPRCNKEFFNKYTFKTHLKICGNNKERQLTFFCDICKKGYCRKNGLRSHLVTNHGFGKVYTCNWCNKPFDATSKLKNHIVKHTRERNFHCDQCGGQFVTHAALVYHIRIHTGEKPFPCDMCGESFLSASRRMEHKRRKHFGPNRKCSICHSSFVTANELKKHIARHQNPHSRLFVAENEGETNVAQEHSVTKNMLDILTDYKLK